MAQPQSPRMVATIIWAALVAGVLVFLGVALFLRMPAIDARLVDVVLPVAGGMSVVTAAVSWLWAVRMTPKLPPGVTPHAPDQLALTRLIVASALCEGAALFAIVGFLLTAEPVMLAPLAVSLVALLAHFPGDRRWAQLTGSPAGAARNPMIRG